MGRGRTHGIWIDTEEMRLFSVSVCLLVAFVETISEHSFVTDSMSDEELIQYRDRMRARLQRLLNSGEATIKDGRTYQIFYCSIYYTPRESGFTAERGFDEDQTTAPGLAGRKYSRAFLEAVKIEGFGRINESVNDRHYLQYVGGGRYRFAKAPLGNRNNVLIPRQSCAISSKNPFLDRGQIITIESPTIQKVTGTTQWRIEDTGAGIHPLQIDLYWGEDDPLGAVGRMRARPAGTRFEYAFGIRVRVQASQDR